MKIAKIFFILFIQLIFVQLVTGERDDTLRTDNEEIVIGFSDNLDSMLNLYYVQQAVAIAEADSLYGVESDTLMPDFPDSVYIERIRKLPFIMEMTYNRIVKNYIDVYSKKRADKVRIMLSLSNYYFPIFEEILDRYGIPDELKYLSVIESALNPRATSRAGATGLWQFMFYTAKTYGLTVNSLVDERRNPVKSTYAAAAFLKDLHDIYKDWLLVIAAYNCGPGNVNKAIRRAGGKRNYWDIYYYLPRETRGYVPAFIAASYIMNYPREHNLNPEAIEFEFHTDTFMISDKLHLRQVSEVLDIPITQLRDLNPQYKYDIIPGDSKSFPLCIPQVKTMKFIELKDSIFAYKDSVFFSKENTIINPTARNSYFAPVLPSDKYTKLTYTVKTGDNLGFVSTWYNVRISDLRYWNNIRTNMIRRGQRLSVYIPNEKADRYRDIDLLSFEEKQSRAGIKTVTASSDAEFSDGNDEAYLSSEYEYYTVRNGDTLWEIAKKYPGVSDTDIARLNNLDNSDNIKPGQVIKIKRKT